MTTLFVSSGLRSNILSNTGLKASLAGGFLHLYASAAANIPASADAAITADHTLLATIYGDGVSSGLHLGTVADGVIGKDPGETWSGPVLVSGTAAFFRFVAPGDDGSASVTQPRLQGTVARTGAHLNLSDPNLVAGTTRAINFVAIDHLQA